MDETRKLSGVPETMLQTVYARAKETQMRGAGVSGGMLADKARYRQPPEKHNQSLERSVNEKQKQQV